ncbi:MAG: hypothetical protein DWB42_18040 [Chloroflexi bacterium]|nr:hypothetical protein [Chloroflexota bacterium]MDL1885773.1 hypothetical protein [Anaerolineae bacterium CFX8]
MQDQLIETWQIHNRINLYVLNAIDKGALEGVASNGGRSVKLIFAHMHNVRLMWLKEIAPDAAAAVENIAAKTNADKAAITKKRLESALTASAQAIEDVLRRSFETGKIRGFKPHPAAFLGYLIAHESYHRGEIGIILTQAGTPLDQKVAYGMWEWGSR